MKNNETETWKMTGLRNKTLIFLLIQLITFIINIQISFCIDKKLGLYSKTESVTVLDDSNFEKLVFDSKSAWLVEYYNSWCGHCIKFAGSYKSLAAKLRAWRPVISIGAIDCANVNNTNICRDHDVQAFPSFKLFQPYATKDAIPKSFHNQDVMELTKVMIDFVSNRTLFEPPGHWPKLTPIVSMHDIWEETRDDHKHVAFIFEKENSYLGRQVILDTLPYKPLLVRRMVKGAVKKFGITAFPSLYLINRDGTFTRLAKSNSTREGMVSSLVSLLGPELLQGAIQVEMKGGEPDEEETEIDETSDTHISPGVYMTDLESTLHYCFRQEVAINKDIDGDKLLALIQFVNVLAKYFPGRPEVVHYLQRVMVWLRGMGKQITGDQWLSGIDELQTVSEYLPDRVEWIGCRGSEHRFRGYPCGMWMLFHTLTASAAQTVRENPRDLPLDILGAIQGYMKHFFGCQVCVGHFLKMADSITNTDKEPRAAMLWLWHAHNKANARLAGDESEDPKHPKVQFPPESLCPNCYDSNGKLTKEKIYYFLLGFYGADGIHPVEDSTEEGNIGSQHEMSDRNQGRELDWWELHQRKRDLEKIHELRMQKTERYKQKKEIRQQGLVARYKRPKDFEKPGNMKIVSLQAHSGGWGINNLDMGMCVFFYILCTLIILVLYYHFIVRRRFKPSALFSSKYS